MHLLRGLEIGGMERAVIRLARRGMREGIDQTLLLFDTPFRSDNVDFSPGNLTTEYMPRRPGIDFHFVKALAEKLTGHQVNVVHAHNDTAIVYAALAMTRTRLAHISLVGTFRNRPTHATFGARLLSRWAAGRAAEIIAVSQELSEWLVQAGWVNRCKTIWNGVDLSEFSPIGPKGILRSQFGIPEDAVLVGHVGRFVPIKRHIDLFIAACRLQEVDPPIRFLLAGDGPLFASFREQAVQLPNVILLSNVTDVASFLRSLDIFVLCSEHEGTPQALLEAMACARPIVATQVGGIPHLLDADAATPAGRLIPPLRPDRLATEIMSLARDRESRASLARLACQRSQAFSFDREWAQYRRLYAAAVRKPARLST
jgi:glycosyltransferase involved in cell wall biosynthesis